MLVGILKCDTVFSSLSAEFGEYPEMMMRAFSETDDTLKFKTYLTDLGQLPDEADDCDAYIITGSRHSVFDVEELWINQLRDFIVRLNKLGLKIIGIGFGHQLIAEAMNGKIERADLGWKIGIHTAQIQQPQKFMQPESPFFHVVMMCEDQIQTVPDSATVIATSSNCESLMLQYNNNILSIQGHPEYSQKFAKSLINTKKDQFPSKRLEKGLASLAEKEPDTKLIFQWFVNFLNS